jgi:Chromosome segregation ATPases
MTDTAPLNTEGIAALSQRWSEIAKKQEAYDHFVIDEALDDIPALIASHRAQAARIKELEAERDRKVAVITELEAARSRAEANASRLDEQLDAAEARATQAEAERDALKAALSASQAREASMREALNAVMDADAFSAIVYHAASGSDQDWWECVCCGEDWETERHDPLAHDPLCPMRKVYSAALSSPQPAGLLTEEGRT